ncbi:hypothetical protein B0H14DRAFT_2916971 [Mycena olivaceomarginata]|nr:hypothetical protein B0H14DRAFT_2916971 [Mycena olivaceomarginata]
MATTPPQLASATMLDNVVLPALTLARAAVTGINIPGVEGTLNGLLELATMLSTMKANKDDLSKLAQSLKKIIDISTAGVDGDLKARLNILSSELGKNLSECEALAGESLFRRFIQSKPYKERIQAIKDSIASQIHNFTFYSNISIEKCVGFMASNVQTVERKIDTVERCVKSMVSNVQTAERKIDTVLANKILDKLKCAPARFNSVNTPDGCMNGTRALGSG